MKKGYYLAVLNFLAPHANGEPYVSPVKNFPTQNLILSNYVQSSVSENEKEHTVI